MLDGRCGGHRRGSPRYSYNAGSAGLVNGTGYPTRSWVCFLVLGAFAGGNTLALYYCWAVFTIFKRWFFIDMDRMSIFSTSSNYVVWTGMG